MENYSVIELYRQMIVRTEAGFPTWGTPILRVTYHYIYILGAALVYILLKTKVTPNQVSVTWWFTGLTGVVLLCIPNFTCVVIGIVILFSADALDAVDGEIARRKGMTSFKGHVLDVCGTTLINIGLMAGIGCFAYNQTGSVPVLFLTIVALFTKSVRLFNIASRVLLIEIVEMSRKSDVHILSQKGGAAAAGHFMNNEKGLRRKLLGAYYYLESSSRYAILTLMCLEMATGWNISVGILAVLTIVNVMHIAMEIYMVLKKRWVENMKEMFVQD